MVPANQQQPIIVHCSAGVGRTGTFIAVERALQVLESGDDSVNVYGIVEAIRQSRNYMVETSQQYVYIHDCIKKSIEERTDSYYGI